ncbi:transmembrane protein 183A [Scomber scombrus]|uniref:Transmembrane protein 183A n=1 Tax=Scomber scombrus TaxID=13677 RepID=A0AAV1N8T3_SCOSC
MPKKGNRKRLKFKAGDVCSESVTVADYADADPAVVKSGRLKKAVANAVEKEASSESSDGGEYPVDIWLVLSSYIRPEDVCRFALICRSAWTVTCTAVFWTRLYRRHYKIDVDLPVRLLPECIDRMRSLRARVIRSLFHLYEPFSLRISKIPALPESTPTTLLNSKCLLFWVKKVSGTRPEAMWEFNFKFIQQGCSKNGSVNSLLMPSQYKDVHTNPDSGCYVLQVTTLNFIFTPVVMGMTLTLFTINVSTDMRHHRVRLVFQDSPIQRGKKRGDQAGIQVVLDPVHSLKLMDWWHPQYPFSH